MKEREREGGEGERGGEREGGRHREREGERGRETEGERGRERGEREGGGREGEKRTCHFNFVICTL